MIQLTDRELGAILAGLRMYQDYPEGDYYDIATDGGSFRALSWPEVDDLCERLNETTFTFCTCGRADDHLSHYDTPIECPTCKAPICTACGECREDLFEDDECPDCKVEYIKESPEIMDGIKQGVAAAKKGRVTPWEDVEKELYPCETCGGSGEIDDLPWLYLPKPCEDCQEI